MSDNVTQLYPEKERKKRFRGWLLLFAGILVLVLAVVSIVLFQDELNLDSVRRFFAYRGVRDSEDYGEYTFDDHNANAYCAHDGGLAVSTVGGLTLYGPSGEERISVPNAIATPAVAAGKDLVLTYDVGGTVLCAAGGGSGVLLNEHAGGPIYDADISADDQICYAAGADGYRTVLTVLSNSQKEVYQWLSSSQYMPVCAISDGGGLLAAVALGQADGVFESRLQLLPTDSEEPGPSAALGNQLIFDLAFVGARGLCAVGESSLLFFDRSAALTGEFGYGDSLLRDFDLAGDGFALLALSMLQAGGRYSVVTVDASGQALGTAELDEEVLDVSAAGGYAAVLTADRLRIYTSDLTLYAETEETLGASDVAMREDGSALLIGSGGAHLYLP